MRCFLKDLPDQTARYLEISRFLRQLNSSYTVAFEYLEKGIVVKGKWYPVVKMEWIRGELLGDYVRSNLSRSEILLDLANHWLDLCITLEHAGISHGDLQHGNIIISGGKPKLIDYDGMFVPALRGRSCNEVGHRNYQHPLRSSWDYNESIDRFSMWVIYSSLVVLGLDSSVWRIAGSGAGEEFLIFKETDFHSPDESIVLGHLRKHADHRLSTIASLLETQLYTPLDQIAKLSQFNVQARTVPQTAVPKSLGGSWIDDHLENRNGDKVKQQAFGAIGPEWILENMVLGQPMSQGFAITFPTRLICALLLIFSSAGLVVGLVTIGNVFGWYAFAVSVSTWTVIALLFATSPERRDLRKRRREIEKSKAGVQALKTKIDFYENEIKGLSEAFDKIKKGFAERRRRLLITKMDEERKVTASIDAVLLSLKARWSQLNRDEVAEKQKMESELGFRISRAKNEIASLSQVEASERNQELKKLQDNYLLAKLTNCRIEVGIISGIGQALVSRLRGYGIECAIDLSVGRLLQVPGIGQEKANALMSWKLANERRFRGSVPVRLPEWQSTEISQRYIKRREKLQLEIHQSDALVKKGAVEIRERYMGLRQVLVRDEVVQRNEREEVCKRVEVKYRSDEVEIARDVENVEKQHQLKVSFLIEEKRFVEAEFQRAIWMLKAQEYEIKRIGRLGIFDFLSKIFEK